MGVYIANMQKPKDCSECILADKHLNGLYEAKYYCRLEADNCPLIEIDDTVWENEKYKPISDERLEFWKKVYKEVSK